MGDTKVSPVQLQLLQSEQKTSVSTEIESPAKNTTLENHNNGRPSLGKQHILVLLQLHNFNLQ